MTSPQTDELDPAASSGKRSEKAPPLPHNPNAIDESRWEKIATNLKTIGGAVLLALVIRTCLFEAFEIEGPSMEPTLLNGDRVVVAKFMYGLFLPFREQAEFTWGSPDLGDVVIIKSPADGVDIVKRVIGIGGDFIEMKREVVYRNGEPITTEDLGKCTMGTGARMHGCHVYQSTLGEHTFETSAARRSIDPMPVHVPADHIYVLGDHRDASNDSRNPAVGAIPVARVKGRALSVYWSMGPNGVRWHRMFSSVH